MATFGDLKTAVSKRLNDPSNTAVSEADVGSAVNDAIRFWRYRPTWFNTTSDTVTLTVNNPVIPSLPSDLLYELPNSGFVINYNNLSYNLEKVSNQRYDYENVRGIGIPYIYTFRDGQYEMYFYPNIAYDMSVYYVKDYSLLSSNSDNNDWTNYADKLVIYDALSRLYAELRQDEKMETYFSARSQNEYENLKIRTASQRATGSLTVETILQ